MLEIVGLSAEKFIVELLDAVRKVRTASNLILDHAESITDLAHLEWELESVNLKQFLFGMQLFAVFVGLTLLYGGLLIAAIAWDTPYRFYILTLLPLLFAVASCVVWRFLGRISRRRKENFAGFSAELGKTLHLLRGDL